VKEMVRITNKLLMVTDWKTATVCENADNVPHRSTGFPIIFFKLRARCVSVHV
jgi:hypothetical protein